MKRCMTEKEGGLVIVQKSFKHFIQAGTIILFTAEVAASCQYKLPAMAAENAEGRLHSTGRIECEEAILDTADLEDIFAHISEKQSAVVNILLQLGTKFRQDEKGIYPDRNPDNIQESFDIGAVNWSILVNAVEESQTVPAGLPVLNPNRAMGIEGVGERTDCYETAVADNISSGKAAWADGMLLLGNGADNDRTYRKGREDGAAGIVPEGWYPVYAVKAVDIEVRHMHIGTEENRDGTSGCYYNYSTIKEEYESCGRTLEQTESSWYPEEDHPDGGTWHGGYYTCSIHGGVYNTPGTCTYMNVKQKTVWHHDIVCGLTDVVYGVLHIRGTDTDYYDGTILLEAELEPGRGYNLFAWRKGNELLWTDEKGNMLGIGPQLTVNSPGIYKCCINAANADIDIRAGSVQVKTVGLVVPGN